MEASLAAVAQEEAEAGRVEISPRVEKQRSIQPQIRRIQRKY